MRLRLPLVLATFGFAAASAAAQHPDPDPRIVIRDTVREVIRTHSAREIARAYQGRDRGPEQTERFSRRVRVGRDGRVSIGNIAGNIVITGGSGDEVSIEAVKRTRGDRSELGRVQIIVDERAGRVDVRTEHERNRYDRDGRNDRVSVDYTVTVPGGATVDAKSISGDVKVSNVQGAVRAESISGTVTTSATPRLEMAKSISGDVVLTDAGADADLSAGTVSGNVRANGLKARALELGTISGDVVLTNVACDRLGVKSVSGNLEYSGTIARNGRYDVNSHSGNIRFTLSGSTGFELTANTFSGSIRSELPLTIGGDRRDDGRVRRRGPNNRSIQATFGDGSAALTIRTFSGDIVIAKR
jgi:Putative adhesin